MILDSTPTTANGGTGFSFSFLNRSCSEFNFFFLNRSFEFNFLFFNRSSEFNFLFFNRSSEFNLSFLKRIFFNKGSTWTWSCISNKSTKKDQSNLKNKNNSF